MAMETPMPIVSEWHFQWPSNGSQVLWFERLADLEADLIAGNAVLSAYASRGDAAKAMQWLHDMEPQPVKTGAHGQQMSTDMGHGLGAVEEMHVHPFLDLNISNCIPLKMDWSFLRTCDCACADFRCQAF